MLILPEKIKLKLEEIKKLYKFFVSLKKINGRYYLYKQTAVWNKEKKKLKVISTYLGRITTDGVFIKREITANDELENARAIIEARGGRVTLPETEKMTEGKQIMPQTIDDLERKIITTLSMNARHNINTLKNQTGLKAATLYSKIRQLEKKYDTKYTIEIDVRKFGYFKFLVMAKFINEKPTSGEIIAAIKNESKIQLATLMSGKYDLLMYVLAESNEAIADLVIKIRKTTLSKYPAEWYIDNFADGFDSVPIRNEFLEEIKDKLHKREYSVLLELNKNSTTSFTEIDRKYGFDSGRAQYTYYRLVTEEKLIRTTISLNNLPLKFIGIIFLSLIEYDKFINNKPKILQNIISETKTVFNKYLLTGDISIPKGIILFLPVLNNGELEREKEYLTSLNLGAKIDLGIITEILLGQFFYRKLDTNYSKQYENLTGQYKFKITDKIDYEKTEDGK